MPNTSNFLFPSSSLFFPSRSRFRDRDSCFYVSLFVVAAQRATATGVRGDIRRNCEGCERVETSRATGRFERARENSSSLFMSFLFDLLSSRFCPSLSLFLSLSLPLPISSSRRMRVQIRREKKTERMGKRAESTRHSFAREGAGNLSFAKGGKKCDIFPRSW